MKLCISLFEVGKRVEKSAILAYRKAQNSENFHFMAVKKSRRHSCFVICQDRITFIFPWILKTVHLQQLLWIQSLNLVCQYKVYEMH